MILVTRKELVLRFRWLAEEAIAIRRHMDRISKIGGPAGISNQAITGMPRGTNDPMAASIQAYDSYQKTLNDRLCDLASLFNEFNSIIESIEDDRARVICFNYYGNGMTDDQISNQMKPKLERSTVTKIRNDTIDAL